MFSLNANTGELTAAINRIKRFKETRPVEIAADVLTKQIKVLSQEQRVSFDGTAFPKLTEAYRKYKVKSGHPGVPNLTFTGKYMNRIGLRKDGDKPYVGPIEAFQPQAEGLSKKRPHFGIHPDSERLTLNGLEKSWKAEGLE